MLPKLPLIIDKQLTCMRGGAESKAESCLTDFWVDVVKNGHDH